MFFGKSNSSDNGVNINTSFYSSYSDTCLLTVGGWNRNLTVKFSPAVGKDSNGLTQYATDNSQIISTSIREENAIALLEGFNKIIKPALTEGTTEDLRVSISMNGTNRKCLTIGYDGTNSYIEIATNVNDDGTVDSNNVIKHIFNKRSYMVNYNSETGSGDEVPVETDLFNFMKKIEQAQELVPMTAHSIKYSNACQKAYGNKSSASVSNNYQSPQSVFNGGDIGDFLPLS